MDKFITCRQCGHSSVSLKATKCPKCDSLDYRPILVHQCACCQKPVPSVEFNPNKKVYCKHCFEDQFGRVRSSVYTCSECKHEVSGNNELITSGKCVCDNCGVEFRPFSKCYFCNMPILPHQSTLQVAHVHEWSGLGHNTIHRWCRRKQDEVIHGLFRAFLPFLGMIAFALWVLWYIFTH